MKNNLIIVILSIVITLLVAEIPFRYLYSPPWYAELKIPKKWRTYNEDELSKFWERYHQKGIRIGQTALSEVKYFDKEKAVVKYFSDQVKGLDNDSDLTRILIIGDSFTYGSGVTDRSKTFPELIEQKQNALAATGSGPTVEVFNGGIPGSLTNWWLDLFGYLSGTSPQGSLGVFEFLNGKFKPDIIVVVFFLRDGTLTSSMGSFFFPIYTEIINSNKNSRIYQYSYIYRYFKDQLDQRYISDDYTKALHTSYFGGDLQTSEWQRAQNNLLTLKRIADEQAIKTALVVFPILIGLDENYPFKNICNEIIDFGNKSGFETFSLLDTYSDFDGPELWVSPADQHPNAKGHEIAAEALVPFIRELL